VLGVAAADPITLWPDRTKEDYWGGWIAGITDGEGSFLLAWERGKIRNERHQPKDRGSAMFRLALRTDDRDTLYKIQYLLGCGWITDSSPNKSTANAKPTSLFCVSKAAELLNVVVPWFERYPLQAKKQRDFLIWKQGVKILYGIAIRPRVRMRAKGGFLPKWTEKDKVEFRRLMFELRGQRQYDAEDIILPEPASAAPRERPLPLFDV
jgi:hypothetical protein